MVNAVECLKPERLNLAIAKRCNVTCSGCYTFFGTNEPDLCALVSSVAAFAALGLRSVTVAGGDPLTIDAHLDLLRALRSVGVRSIKVDTVGVGLLQLEPLLLNQAYSLSELVNAVDFLGVPLDGWSNESVLTFRHGRPELYVETVTLLETLNQLCQAPKVVINTVVHRENARNLIRIRDEVLCHPAICHWNLFQYTPTDQAAPGANARFRITDAEFESLRRMLNIWDTSPLAGGTEPQIEFHSTRSRLGQYLLVNSDCDAWLPDEEGNTVLLGNIIGREKQVLDKWAEYVLSMRLRLENEIKPRALQRVG